MSLPNHQKCEACSIYYLPTDLHPHLLRSFLSPFLLTLLVISSLQLAFELFKSKPPAHLASVALHDGAPDDRRIVTAPGLGDLLERLSRRALFLKVLEGLSLVLSTGLALYRLSAKSHASHSEDLYFWLYLAFLYVLRTPLAASLRTFRQTIQRHANFLYIVRWSTALVVLRTQHEQSDRMFASQQADFALMVTTTILLIVLLSSPRTLATVSPAYPDPTRESYSSIVGMASFAWLDSLLTGRWYSDKIKLQDVPILSSVDAAASNVQAFHQVRFILSRLFRLT